MDNYKQKAFESWDLNQERIFLENLLQQRFNFFIVVFTLIMAGGTSANSISELNWLLMVGFFLCILLGLSVYRVFTKVDAVLRMIREIDDHVMHVVAIEAEKRKWPFSFKVNDIIGYVIPLFCLLVIVIWFALANLGYIHVI